MLKKIWIRDVKIKKDNYLKECINYEESIEIYGDNYYFNFIDYVWNKFLCKKFY